MMKISANKNRDYCKLNIRNKVIKFEIGIYEIDNLPDINNETVVKEMSEILEEAIRLRKQDNNLIDNFTLINCVNDRTCLMTSYGNEFEIEPLINAAAEILSTAMLIQNKFEYKYIFNGLIYLNKRRLGKFFVNYKFETKQYFFVISDLLVGGNSKSWLLKDFQH